MAGDGDAANISPHLSSPLACAQCRALQKFTMTSQTHAFDDLKPSRADIERMCDTQQPTTLTNCDLDGLDLSDLDFTGWCFDHCGCKRTSFNGSQLDGTSFKSCRAADARFLGAALQESTIDGGDFSNTDFRNALLADITIRHCKMTGADLTDAKTANLVLQDVLLVFAILPKLSFRKMTLRRVNFSEADLRSCDFRDSIFDDCSLRDANLENCMFENADLRGADLSGVRLHDARRFKGALISKRQAAELLAQLGLRVF